MSAVVEKAREYLGTPFVHQGRLKGVGVDCVGLLTGVARELGISQRDDRTYARQPDGEKLLRVLREEMDEVPLEEARPGDVAVFWISRRTRRPQHIAILSDVGMIHTYADVGRVVETNVGRWRRRTCAVFRFKAQREAQESAYDARSKEPTAASGAA